jgi:hypothetical protein
MIVAAERQPERDPIAEEGERILRERPELRARLKAFQRDYSQGKAKLVEHEEIRRLLKERGVTLED